MHEWLSRQADAIAKQADVPRDLLELSAHDVATLLDAAAHAAHEGGARTNAPLLCYLLGLAHGGAKGLDELVEIVRSTS